LYSVKGAGNHVFRTNDTNQTQFQISHTASAVNYVQVTGAATGGIPAISAQGSDSNVSLVFQRKGSGQVFISSPTNLGTIGANNIGVLGAAAGASPTIQSQGSDTNIDINLTPKGIGNVRFGTYTGTILTPTGYVEIKDSGGTVRRLLVG
jgi:hypothetical protein